MKLSNTRIGLLFKVSDIGTKTLIAVWLTTVFIVCQTVSENLGSVIIYAVIFLALSLWGHVAVFPVFYRQGRFLEGFVIGSATGTAIGALITSVIVFIGGWNFFAIIGVVVIVPAAVLIVIFIFYSRVNECDRVREQSANWVLIAAMILVTAFFYFPFKNFGTLLSNKYVYSWLFGHDFIVRMVHVISLSQGLPLDSFFYSGEKLSYYWLAYVPLALLKNLPFVNLETQQLLQLGVFTYALLTTAVLVVFLRDTFGDDRNTFIIVTLVAFICYSYSGLYNILVLTWEWWTGDRVANFWGFNLGDFSGFSHTFYRFFLVQPQASLAVALVISTMLIFRNHKSFFELCLIGLMIGLLFGVEATNGLILGGWFFGTFILEMIFGKSERWPCLAKYAVAFGCIVAVYALLFSIEMYDLQTGRGALGVWVNPFALKFAVIYFPVEYGPMFILGILGLWKFGKQTEQKNSFEASVIILLGIALFFVFFVKSGTEPNFGLLKATRILPICFLLFGGYWLKQVRLNRKYLLFLIACFILAAPSLFTDILTASRVTETSTFVRKEDKDAAIWINENLPLNAVVQAEPNYPGIDAYFNPRYYYSFIPIFSERRTAVGEWKVSSQEHGKVEEAAKRFHDIKLAFSTQNIEDALRVLDANGIEYIYVGELERNLYPDGIPKFFIARIFEKIYSKDGVSILKLKQPKQRKVGAM